MVVHKSKITNIARYLDIGTYAVGKNVNENRNIAAYAPVNTDEHPVTRRKRQKSRKPTLGYFLFLFVCVFLVFTSALA